MFFPLQDLLRVFFHNKDAQKTKFYLAVKYVIKYVKVNPGWFLYNLVRNSKDMFSLDPYLLYHPLAPYLHD